jgi:hypothetical protein
MAPSPRDRISVDLRGLKAALFERARARGISPSGLVRDALSEALGQTGPIGFGRVATRPPLLTDERVRLSLRMSGEEARAILSAAHQARLAPGAYVAGLVAGVPVMAGGASRDEHIAALIASSAELSTLSRDIHHLTSLLHQGNARAAQEYRQRLDTLAGDVRSHLLLAGDVLAGLRPRSQRADAASHSST